MKKLFVLLLALTVLAGAVFAQATVNGYVRSMATYNSETESFNLYNRLRLALGWTSEDKNVTFGARVQASDWTGASNAMAVADYAYGKIKLADGMFVISGGRLWNFDYDISSTGSDYAATGNVANGGGYATFDGVDGMLFQVMPVEGLNIGLLLTPDSANVGYQEFGLGAKYAIADIGEIVFSMKGAAALEDSALSASFAFTGVENLYAAVGYKGLATSGVYGLFQYTMDALFIELAPEMNFDTDVFYIEALVKYTMDKVAIAGLFGYDKDMLAGNFAYTTGVLAGLTDEMWFGAEVYFTFGKGQLVATAEYGDATGFSLDFVTKVSF